MAKKRKKEKTRNVCGSTRNCSQRYAKGLCNIKAGGSCPFGANHWEWYRNGEWNKEPLEEL